MCPIDNRGARLLIVIGLSTQLTAKVLDNVCNTLKQIKCDFRLHTTELRHIYSALHSGGRSRAFAISTLFTTHVLIPLPRPSTCKERQILYMPGQADRKLVNKVVGNFGPSLPSLATSAFCSGKTDRRHCLAQCWQSPLFFGLLIRLLLTALGCIT